MKGERKNVRASERKARNIPHIDQLVIDGRVLAFTFLATVLACVMFGFTMRHC